jgi:hypothetical protein
MEYKIFTSTWGNVRSSRGNYKIYCGYSCSAGKKMEGYAADMYA